VKRNVYEKENEISLRLFYNKIIENPKNKLKTQVLYCLGRISRIAGELSRFSSKKILRYPGETIQNLSF